ncbi:hypothetical protein [Glycomyces sp. NPDC048151]|uniref:hypothetical protein n=1 Tax=Glycomyces sp. NPDC048151 TaxID=3364002 RepID=UPI003716B2A4
MDENGAPEEEAERVLARLEPWARFAAMGLGAVLAVIGCWAVVTDSGNQAGTVGVFGAGLVLLVMGLQNTPLTGITAGGGASFGTRQQVERTKQLAEEKLDEGEPDEAKAVIETAKALHPRINESPVIRGLDYEVKLGLALAIIVPEHTRWRGPLDGGADYVVQTPSGHRIAVLAKYFTNADPRHVMRTVSRMRLDWYLGAFSGVLLVTNYPMPDYAQIPILESHPDAPVKAVSWDGGLDVTELRQGLEWLDERPQS